MTSFDVSATQSPLPRVDTSSYVAGLRETLTTVTVHLIKGDTRNEMAAKCLLHAQHAEMEGGKITATVR